MATRKLVRLIPKVVSGAYQPDTGLTVTLRTDEASPVIVTTATESPANSGSYRFDWTTTPKWGYVYIGATKQDHAGRVWLGTDGQLRPTFIFRKVKFYDSGDSPTGVKGSPKTFTTGSGALATDEDGNTTFSFTKVPIVAMVKFYQERKCFVSNTPSLSGGNVTLQVSADDAGEDSGDGKSYADIVIISLD